MSVTTTTDQLRYTAHAHLADYALHHSDSEGPAPPPNAHPEADTYVQPPSDWPTDHRRVPPYRPINRDLDLSERAVYLSTAEHVFITVMFAGVESNAKISRLWGATGGRILENLFRYKIGGEW